MAIRLLIIVILFSSQFASALKPESWQVTALSDQTFLFEKNKVTVLVDVDPLDDTDESVAKFVRSGDFVKAMKLLRTSESLGLDGEEVTVSASRKQYGTTYVGITESLFKIGDRSAVLTEHWWVKSKFAFHISILSRGNFAKSDEEQEQIFLPFAKDLGLVPNEHALLETVFPKAWADEVGVTRTQRRSQATQAQPQKAQPAVDCQRDAASLGIDPKLARRGAPSLAPSYSNATCKQGIVRVWTETKQAFFDFGHEYAQRQQRYEKQMNCRGLQLQKGDLMQARQGEWFYQRWSRNIYNAVVRGSVAQAQANCEEAAGNGALGEMAGNAIVSTARSLATLGALTQQLQYEMTIGNARRVAQLIQYGKVADNDPMLAFATMVGNQWTGFKCYSDKEQMARICKIGAEVGKFAGEMAVGGAIGAGARMLRVANLVSRAVEAERVAAKAVTAAREVGAGADALKAAQEANRAREAAANALKAANLSQAERARAAARVLGRSMSTTERAAVERAHAFGKVGSNGSYSVGDLREKLRIMMTDGKLTKAQAMSMLRTGVTGNPPAAAALQAAAAAEASEHTAPGGSVAESTIVTRGSEGKPASYFRTEAQHYQQAWAKDLDALGDPNLTKADLAIRDIPAKATDVSRMLMRSISPEDISNTEFVTNSAGGRYVQMMRMASYGGSSPSNEAGQMLARVVRDLPPDKRADFISSLNSQFTLQNQVMRGDRTIAATERMGSSFPQVMERTYREIVDNAMGFSSSTSPEAQAFHKKLDGGGAAMNDAINELLARPQMQGISRDELQDLRSSAAAGLARAREAAEAERRAAAGATAVKPANNGLKPTVVPLGPLNR